MFTRNRRTSRRVGVILAVAVGLVGLGERAPVRAAGALRPTSVRPTSGSFFRPVPHVQTHVSGFSGFADAASCSQTRAHLIRTQTTTKTGTAAQSILVTVTDSDTGRAHQSRLNGYFTGQTFLSSQAGDPVLYGGYIPTALASLGAAAPGPYAPSLDGSASLADTPGRLLVSEQQAAGLRELARQARVRTRRRAFDEYLYERQLAPTWEDDRERFQSEEVRRSRTDPPLNEIVSAKALNALLDDLQKLDAGGMTGPEVPLDEDVLGRVNVTSGRGGHIGLLKNGGRLHWPLALTDEPVRTERQQIDGLLGDVLNQAGHRTLDGDAVEAMTRAADRLQQYLARRSRDLPPGQYVEAKRFLTDLEEALKALQQPDAGEYLSHRYAARGRTVLELVRSMTRQGLRFAPAVNGDEAAYLALHRALAQYDRSAQGEAKR